MKLPLIVAIKKRHDSDVEFISQETSKTMAEAKAEMHYVEEQCFMVCVLEIDKLALFEEDKVNTIFKIERRCKCTSLQREFNYKRGQSELFCTECKASYRGVNEINEEEESPTGTPILAALVSI